MNRRLVRKNEFLEIYINGFLKYLFFRQPTLKYICHVNYCPSVYSILYQDYF